MKQTPISWTVFQYLEYCIFTALEAVLKSVLVFSWFYRMHRECCVFLLFWPNNSFSWSLQTADLLPHLTPIFLQYFSSIRNMLRLISEADQLRGTSRLAIPSNFIQTWFLTEDEAFCTQLMAVVSLGNVTLCTKTKLKLHGLSPRANYTNRATAACRRSDCQFFADTGCHVVSVTDPYGRILDFLDRSRYFSIK
jgi:hypothetical protein